MTLPNWIETVQHDGSPKYVIGDNFSLGETVTLRLRVGLAAPIERVYLRTCPDGEQAMVLMKATEAEAGCSWWEAKLKLDMPRTHYRFFLMTAEGGWWFSAVGMTRYNPPDHNDFKVLAGFKMPDWVNGTVFYQIFPDRFADGDHTNNVTEGEYLCHGIPVKARQWGEPPRPGFQGGSAEFYGGDLAGITQRLDYLEELGVNGIYLTPVFTSPSNHKYDVEDYRRVDPHFGGDEALIGLREATRARDMRLLLDIVPNHCSASHPWFLKAQADPQAETTEYFTFHQHPNDYESWLGVRSLPKLNYRSEKLREEMYQSAGAVMRYWLQPPFSIDGWRVDVANMMGRQGETQLGHKIGRGVRRATKSESTQAYLVGEHFHDGTSHLQGDELDACMNYQGFTFPVWQWLAGYDMSAIHKREYSDPIPMPTKALAAQWRDFMAAIPWQVANQQFNQLGSHDTPRILSIVGEDKAKMRVAVTLLFTFPGVPCLYYGDEVGLTGAGDPDNRRTMPWQTEEWDTELREFYRTLIHFRRSSNVLQQGGFQIIYAAGDTLAFQRETANQKLLIVARRADDGLTRLPLLPTALTDGTRMRELLSGHEEVVEDGHLSLIKLPAIGGQIWQIL